MESLRKMLTILQLDNLHPNFEKEGVRIEDIPELSDKNLIELGVKTIGDRARLKKLCRSSLFGESSCMDRNANSDQTYRKTVLSSDERLNIQPSQNSWSGGESSNMSVPDRSAGPASVPFNDFDVQMAHGARVDIGDRENVKQTGDRIDADEINNINTELGAASSSTQSNPQYRIPQNARFNLGEGAVFEMGNRNNVEQKGSRITAKKIGTYSSKIG